MTEHNELIHRAAKGDKVAMEKLFAMGEDLVVQQRFQDATTAFREAAISYRISAFRNLAHAEDADRRARWMASARDIYADWIEKNPQGFRALPRQAPGVDFDGMRDVILNEMLHEERFDKIFYFLENTLHELGMPFFMPGGSIERQVIYLLGEAFGLSSNYSRVFGPNAVLEGYHARSAIRVAIDQIADEVETRCSVRKKKPSAQVPEK